MLRAIYSLAFRLHKLPSEIRQMPREDLIYLLAHQQLEKK